MKTLIVKYLPTGADSNTKKLLDLFLAEIKNKNSEVEEVDLLKKQMPIFDEQSIQAYYKRNYGGQELNADEAKLLEKNDELVSQLKSADVLVLAYPMHNFGPPASIKAYLDAVIMKGVTFDYGEKKMVGKKALTLFTSGGVYSNDTFNFEYPNWNSIALMSAANFTFMGFDEFETIGTSLRDENTRDDRLKEMQANIKETVEKWYQ